MTVGLPASQTSPPRHCDAQGMMHASRPYEYFEDAFLAWLDDACGGYGPLRAAGYDFVIVESRCFYLQPAHLNELITIEVRPISAGKTAFINALDMKRDGATIAVGAETYVGVPRGTASRNPVSRARAAGQQPRARRSRCRSGDLGRTAQSPARGQGSFYAGGDDAPEPCLTPTCDGMYPARAPSRASISALIARI
jgi:acyl-CoA thioesterase FadM